VRRTKSSTVGVDRSIGRVAYVCVPYVLAIPVVAASVEIRIHVFSVHPGCRMLR